MQNWDIRCEAHKHVGGKAQFPEVTDNGLMP